MVVLSLFWCLSFGDVSILFLVRFRLLSGLSGIKLLTRLTICFYCVLFLFFTIFNFSYFPSWFLGLELVSDRFI